MKKYCFIQKIVPETRDEYIRLHKKAWPELLHAISDAGVENEVLFIYENLVVLYYECDDINHTMQILSKSEISRKWTKLMKPFIEYTPDYYGSRDIESFSLEMIFDLKKMLENIDTTR